MPEDHAGYDVALNRAARLRSLAAGKRREAELLEDEARVIEEAVEGARNA